MSTDETTKKAEYPRRVVIWEHGINPIRGGYYARLIETSRGVYIIEVDERDAMGVTRWVEPPEGIRAALLESSVVTLALRRQRDDEREKARALEGEVARLRERIGELEEREVEVRSDLAEAQRELGRAGAELTREIAKRLQAYSARTAAATRAEHLDAVTAIDERLGEVLRWMVFRPNL